jgi:hypothetical protein
MNTSVRTYANEFPGFELGADITMPKGFVDESWHNDLMPTWINESLGLQIWVDHQDAAQREFPEAKRFTLCRIEGGDDIIETDNFREITLKIEELQARPMQDFIDATMAEMSVQLNVFCTANGLPHLSADEISAEDGATPEHLKWLNQFCEMWDAVVGFDSLLYKQVPKVGDRIRLIADAERGQNFTVPKGEWGTVTVSESALISAKMDNHIEGCAEWDNELQWHTDNPDNYTETAIGSFRSEARVMGAK